MNVAIIDADLITRKKHRFPNLVCMKLSGYWKEQGAEVQLKTDYERLEQFDKVFISKVFTDTPIDGSVLELPNVEYGGTGFFFDKAPDLPHEIEHHMPDYHLYDAFVQSKIDAGTPRNEFKEYLDYSIGYITRGCFRKCGFCVNKKYDRAFAASPLEEFYDDTRPKICLLDDNFFSFPQWKCLLEQLEATGKPFKFKQGLDERLLTDEKVELLCKAKYDGEITFAFDKVEDYELIESKLQMLRRHTNRRFTYYVLVGYQSQDHTDIANAFKRIELLMKYECLPYIMRFEDYKNSRWKDIYINLAKWCNQPNFFKKTSFREFIELIQKSRKNQSVIHKAKHSLLDFEQEHSDIAAKYFDMKWGDKKVNLYELTGQWMELQDMLNDPESDLEAVIGSIEALDGEIEVKADGYAKMIRNLDGNLISVIAEMERLKTRKNMYEASIKWLKKSLQGAMVATGKRNFKTALFTFTVKKAGGKDPVIMDITDTSELPDELVKIEEKPDLDAIRELIQKNGGCKYAHLGQKQDVLVIK